MRALRLRGQLSLSAAVRGNDDLEGPEQDGDVLEQRPVGNVFRVEIDPPGVADIAAAADLPEPGHSGAGAKIAGVALAIVWRLIDNDGTGPHQAHLAPDHVEQLRQLVEAGDAQEAADRGNARVPGQLARRLPFPARHGVAGQIVRERGFGVWNHGAELVAAERPASETDALMGEYDRSRPGHADRQRDETDKREEEEQQQRGADKIHYALEAPTKRHIRIDRFA